MIFEAKCQRTTCWHRWFAWRPIEIMTIEGCQYHYKYIWCQEVWRRESHGYFGSSWDYSLAEEKPKDD